MMAINKFKTSMAALTNELTVAAANINIDFTLIKCEAPKEYQGLGNDLSKKHKSDAETGTIHATAQRLGNLFQGVCPPTPKLVKAYGTRISEISNAAKCETSPRNVNPIFADYSGVDGASIWAAATSSATALQVQMLACMLAYHWKAPDATAIWVEIVKERKRQIASIFEGDQSLPFSTLTAAAQQDMPRSELADWDASARAWIRVAERIKSREQKKLTLILNNIGIPVNKDEVVYSSVLAAWTTALKTMESLLSGMPQATQSGAIPLALYAWHLYPDIVVPSANAELRIQDSLIPPGGVLTLGLAHAGAESRSGVSWSLSLAHLRYYGHPVRREQPLSQAVTRATFREFTQAVFGSLLGCWQITGSETKLSAEFFAGIQTALEQDTTGLAPLYRRDSSRWLHLMMDAARALLDEPGAKVPFELGQRRWRNFIGKPELHSFFGLSTPGILLDSLDGPEARISFLRYFATKQFTHLDAKDIMIRYLDDNGHAHLATARPIPCQSHKRKRNKHDLEEDGEASISHHRWFSQKDCLHIPQEICIESTIGKHTLESTSIGTPLFSENKIKEGILGWTFIGPQIPFFNDKTYNVFFGDPGTAALFIATEFEESVCAPQVEVQDLAWCMNSGLFSLSSVLSLTEWIGSENLQRTMRALGVAEKVYELFPETTIDTSVLDRPLYETQWASSLWQSLEKGPTALSEEESPDRCTTLSCIAYFQSSDYDIAPNQLRDVIALSHEDSLFISMQLVCDPYETPGQYEFKRVLGNIGKAGLNLLIPPQNPMMRDVSKGSWRVISGADFNGEAEDFFSKTSLHLSFTEYQVPLFVGRGGGLDNQIFLLESVVSVHDSGAWVADIDIIGALSDPLIRRASRTASCQHQCSKPLIELKSLECWDGILDRPQEAAVVRANSNWIARLAATAVLVQCLRGSDGRVTICPPSMCWSCSSVLLKPFNHVLVF